MVRQRSAKPLFPSSNLGVASIKNYEILYVSRNFFRQFQICIGINALHLCLTTSFLPAQDFASVTRRESDEERSVRTGTRVSEERAATQSMAQKTSRSKAEVCETPIPQFKSGCRLQIWSVILIQSYASFLFAQNRLNKGIWEKRKVPLWFYMRFFETKLSFKGVFLFHT